MEQLQFKLDVFEGPLDLMLHLISKHALDINDIAITVLLEQYLDYIARMQAADLEIATEFLTMAARLVYIKTVSLLPQHEEAEQLKQELQGQLLEYQLCRQMAERLAMDYRGGLLYLRSPQPVEPDKTYQTKHEPEELRAAYLLAAGKARRRLPPPKTAFSGIVSKRMVSVESRIVAVLQMLYQQGSMPYGAFFLCPDRSEMVATFLAMLELIKSGRIVVDDSCSTVSFRQGAAGEMGEESDGNA